MRGVALRAALELVVVVDDDLGQRQLEGHQDALRVEVLHRLEGAAPVRGQLHERADVRLGRDDRDLDPRLRDGLDVADGGQLGRVVDDDLAAAVGERDVVLDRRRGRDEVEVELALQALLDDLHVQQAQEAAAEAEAERDRGLRLEGDRRVVEVQLLEGVAQQRVVRAVERVDAREDQRLGLLVAGQRRRRPGASAVSVSPTWQSRTLLRPVAT